MQDKLIWQHKHYRIVETIDEWTTHDELRGDTFTEEANPDIPADILQKERYEFDKLVQNEGVYGYVLEYWNPEIGMGWQHVDSCFGFVGRFDSSSADFNHYIVQEMKDHAMSTLDYAANLANAFDELF